MNFFLNKKGQSTIEYMLVIAAVILVLFVFVGPGGPLHKSMNSTLEKHINVMDLSVRRIF